MKTHASAYPPTQGQHDYATRQLKSRKRPQRKGCTCASMQILVHKESTRALNLRAETYQNSTRQRPKTTGNQSQNRESTEKTGLTHEPENIEGGQRQTPTHSGAGVRVENGIKSPKSRIIDCTYPQNREEAQMTRSSESFAFPHLMHLISILSF